MRKVVVLITLKNGVLDPQGKAIQESLNTLGYGEVTDARVRKSIELTMDDHENVEERVKDMCEKLLANPVIEDYHIEMQEGVQS